VPINPTPPAGGILIGPLSRAAALAAGDQLTALMAGMGLRPSDCDISASSYRDRQFELHLSLQPETAQTWAPDFDTLDLARRLQHELGAVGQTGDDQHGQDLQREALVAMLASPVPVTFPSADELLSALRMRSALCRAASRTAMDFHTAKVDRPETEWAYDEDRGFTLREGRDLIEALRLTTQPEVSGRLYAFSCYRATEYIVLLAMAEELRHCHPELFLAVEAQWRQEAIASGRFHDTFLHELGSNELPLPIRYYVPGDRVWFRNPDEVSSDASGYEGSWTMYLGRGLFANMWKRNQPFTLLAKCVEIYHWRDAVYRDAEGEPRIDETIVEREVSATFADADRAAAICERMLRLRDLKGVYSDGGCIDRTREGPRWVRPGTTDIPLHPLLSGRGTSTRAGDRPERKSPALAPRKRATRAVLAPAQRLT
jgi:Protein-glutamine gamma-glutamyltransferase